MTYKQEDTGNAVKVIQRTLKAAGYNPGIADGNFGQKTKDAVMAAQRSLGMQQVDGIVGTKTLEAITKAAEQTYGITITRSPITVHLTRAERIPQFIVIHYTAGRNSRRGAAMAVRNAFLSRSASADFVVDDETIVQVSPDLTGYYTWAVGDKRNPWSGGGQLYGKATNRNTINIEICSTLDKGTTSQIPNHTGWHFTPQALKRTQQLVRFLMTMYDIKLENVIRHYDASGKLCPGIIGWNDGPQFSTTGEQIKGSKSDSKQWKAFVDSI